MVKYISLQRINDFANMEKKPDDLLQQELLREKAEVLGRAGDSVDRALIKLRHLGASIEGRCNELHRPGNGTSRGKSSGPLDHQKRIIGDINEDINRYNLLREYAQLRYHYLIITREAMGLRKHQHVEEVYPMPPKKKQLQEI
jgi:hypothetical protein